MMASNWFPHGLGHVWLPYTQMKTAPAPLPVKETDGVRIILEDGRALIDGVGSWWTSVHGYNHPHIRRAVSNQLERMPHVMLGGLAHEQAYRLARRLADITPSDLTRVFFSESGSVSVEIAMKIAIQYWMNRGTPGRTKFVSFKGGYHGDTLATMSVCDPEEGMHGLFGSALQRQHVFDLPETDEDFEKLESFLATERDIAAVVMEPLLQGAGGMRIHSPEIVQRIRKACDAHDTLLIFDEIFTGFGRTGAMFASVVAGVTPDIMTLSKALTGGVLPLAATIASAGVYDAFHSDDPAACLMHGPTYSGNALACAAANASLDLFETEPRLEQVAAIEAHLKEALAPARDIDGVTDVRVLGAMGAIEAHRLHDVDTLKARFVSEGVFIRPFGRVIYTTPAYTIGMEDLTRLTDVMVKVTADHLGA